MTFTTRAIKETEREECIELWRTVWRGDNSDAYFRRYFYGDIEWLPYYTQVGVLDGRLVSAVQVCKRIVACGDYRLTMGGIANVATLPEYRGRGYNTRCLEQAVAVMAADAMDFSLLFTGINDYYSRQGFATIERRWLSGTIRPDFRNRPSDFTVRTAVAADVPAVYSIYDVYNRHRPITVQRTPAYWRDWIGIAADREPRDMLVALDVNGTVRGYVQCGTFRSAKPYSADAEGVRVIELGIDTDCGPETEGVVTAALLGSVAAASLEQGQTMLRLDLLGESAVEQCLADLLIDREEHVNVSGMGRLLHRENLLRAFSMEWNARWIAAGRPAGVVSFETPYGPICINATGGLLRIEEGLSDSRSLSQSILLGLMFGFMSATEIGTDTASQSLLDALFPRCAAAYYGADGF